MYATILIHRVLVYAWGLLGIVIDMNFRYHLYLESLKKGGQDPANGDTLKKYDVWLKEHTFDLWTALGVYTALYGIWAVGILPDMLKLVGSFFGSSAYWQPKVDMVVGWFSGTPNFATIFLGMGALELFEWCGRIWNTKVMGLINSRMKKP
jgi:hypothetical protein